MVLGSWFHSLVFASHRGPGLQTVLSGAAPLPHSRHRHIHTAFPIAQTAVRESPCWTHCLRIIFFFLSVFALAFPIFSQLVKIHGLVFPPASHLTSCADQCSSRGSSLEGRAATTALGLPFPWLQLLLPPGRCAAAGRANRAAALAKQTSTSSAPRSAQPDLSRPAGCSHTRLCSRGSVPGRASPATQGSRGAAQRPAWCAGQEGSAMAALCCPHSLGDRAAAGADVGS